MNAPQAQASPLARFLDAASKIHPNEQRATLLSAAFVFVLMTAYFMNFVTALMWPYFVATFATPWGAIGLGVAFVVFSRFLQPVVERWLEREDDDSLSGDGPAAG